MATRTDLGKWMITNGRNYDPEVTYEEKTFVLYRNSTYISLQTVRGVEPSDDGVHWQLMAKGFAGSEMQIEGYVFVDNEEVIAPEADPALDADKLGGNLPDYYAPQHEISDAFSETKSYAVGDYCIYLNALYRFTNAKAAGEWDGTAVVPVTLAQEVEANASGIAALNSNFDIKYIPQNDFITLNSGFSITDDYSIHKQGPHIWGYMVIESVDEIEGSHNIGRLKYLPKNQSNYACILTSSQWSGEISVGYFFYSSKEMIISNVGAVHGMKFAKIKFDYITN